MVTAARSRWPSMAKTGQERVVKEHIEQLSHSTCRGRMSSKALFWHSIKSRES